jgi:hypothetical protein
LWRTYQADFLLTHLNATLRSKLNGAQMKKNIYSSWEATLVSSAFEFLQSLSEKESLGVFGNVTAK